MNPLSFLSTMNNKLSIIIPFYNGDEFINRLIDSIYHSIINAPSNYLFQIVVIIDSISSSKEDLYKLFNDKFFELKNVELNIIKNEVNVGVAKSRNVGLNISDGGLIHLIDQDDAVDVDFYKCTIEKSSNFNFILVNGMVFYKESKFKPHKLYYLNQNLSLDNLVSNDFIRSPGQILFSRDLIKGFSFPEPTKFKGSDDRFFWFNIFFKNHRLIKPFYIDKPLYLAFIHDENYSADSINLLKSSLENWDIFLRDNYPSKELLNKINNNISSLKYSAGIPQNPPSYIKGVIYRFCYFLDLNKVIRFFYKRVF